MTSQSTHRLLPLACAATIAAVAAVAAGSARAEQELPFGQADLFFELNDTDGDLGLHAQIDGEPWKMLEIEDPRDRSLLGVLAEGRLGRQGMTELAFESAEPPFDELSPVEFFRRFPEGQYEISGITLEGVELESVVRLSHVMPAPAGDIRVSGQPAAEDCDAVLPRVSRPVVIRWSAVTGSHPDISKPGPVQVERYQVFVESRTVPNLKSSLDLPPGTTAFTVPEELLRQSRDFKFEILTRAANRNQTAIESCFVLR